MSDDLMKMSPSEKMKAWKNKMRNNKTDTNTFKTLFKRKRTVTKDLAAPLEQSSEPMFHSQLAMTISEAFKDLSFFDDEPELQETAAGDTTRSRGCPRPKCKHTSLVDFIEQSLCNQPSSKWTATSQLLASKDKLIDAMNVDYTEVLLDQADLGQEGVAVHLLAASNLVQEFLYIQEFLVERTSMPESLQEMIFTTLEDYIRPRIVDHYTEPLLSNLTPGDAAKVVVWTEDYLETIQSNCPAVTATSKWDDDRETLVDIYMERAVRQEMRKMIQHCNDLPPNARTDSEGKMVTGTPEEVSFIVDSQISVAKACLPSRYTVQVLHICNQELLSLVGDLMLHVGTDWKQFGSELFCAMINDGSRMADLCQERNDMYLENSNNDEYQALGDSVVREFSEFSLHTTTFLCEYLMGQLREPEPILTSVGTASWEAEDTKSAVERTVATLNDYFSDLHGWLVGDYFFPKVLKSCFDLTLQVYVESFFSNTLSRGVNKQAQVSRQLINDYLRLVVFFNGKNFERYHGVAGYYNQQTVNDRLHILCCFSRLVDPAVTPEDASGDVKLLLEKFRLSDGSNAAPAILHVVGLRKQRKESIEWLSVVSMNKKKLRQQEGRGDNKIHSWQAFKLPDLRNSKCLQNVRPGRNDFHRRISADSRALLEATSNLLIEAPRYTNPLFAYRKVREAYAPAAPKRLPVQSSV